MINQPPHTAPTFNGTQPGASLPSSAPSWAGALVACIVEGLVRDPDALRHVVAMEDEMLDVAYVRRALGFAKNESVMRLVKIGGLPMFRIPGSRHWRISRKEFRKAVARQFRPLKRSNKKFPIGEL